MKRNEGEGNDDTHQLNVLAFDRVYFDSPIASRAVLSEEAEEERLTSSRFPV